MIKLLTKVVLLFCLSLGSAGASSITLSNFTGASTNLISDSAGNLLPEGSGYVAIGTFPNLTDAGITGIGSGSPRTNLADRFQQFSNSVSFGFNGFSGIYQDVVTDAITSGGIFDGQPIYTVMGNESTLEASCQILVYKHSTVFGADPAPTPDALLSGTSGGTLLIGDYDKYRATLGPIEDQPAYSLHLSFGYIGCIPEPSAAGLLGLGVGVILLRRKRS